MEFNNSEVCDGYGSEGKRKKQRDDHGRPLWHLILDHILAFDLFDDHQSC